MESKPGSKEVVGLNNFFSSSTNFASFSNIQDFPFFDSHASLSDLTALAFQQHGLASSDAFPAPPPQLQQQHQPQQQTSGAAASSGATNLSRSDSFTNMTSASLQNLGLYLSEQQQQQHEHHPPPAQPQADNVMMHPPPAQPKHNPGPYSPSPSSPSLLGISQHQQASSSPKQTAFKPIQPQPPPPQHAPVGIAAKQPNPPIHPYPIHFAQPFAYPPPSQDPFPQPHMPQPQQPSPVNMPRPILPSHKHPQRATAHDFSNTLYSLASTLPPPVVLSNDAILGSVGAGLHFQRHCVRRRTLEGDPVTDPSMFLN